MITRYIYWMAALAWLVFCWWWFMSHIASECRAIEYANRALLTSSAVEKNDVLDEVPLVMVENPVMATEIAPTQPKESTPSTYSNKGTNTVQIERVENRITIHYPYNSVEKADNAILDRDLQDIAQRIRQAGQKVLVSGFTDNVGTPKNNMEISKKRAQRIAFILEKYGLPKAQIKVDWYGERNPIRTNDTQQGRDRNRRVEITILE